MNTAILLVMADNGGSYLPDGSPFAVDLWCGGFKNQVEFAWLDNTGAEIDTFAPGAIAVTKIISACDASVFFYVAASIVDVVNLQSCCENKMNMAIKLACEATDSVEVFDVLGTSLGMANTPDEYVTLWNANATNQLVGVLYATPTPWNFILSYFVGSFLPSAFIANCYGYYYGGGIGDLDFIFLRTVAWKPRTTGKNQDEVIVHVNTSYDPADIMIVFNSLGYYNASGASLGSGGLSDYMSGTDVVTLSDTEVAKTTPLAIRATQDTAAVVFRKSMTIGNVAFADATQAAMLVQIDLNFQGSTIKTYFAAILKPDITAATGIQYEEHAINSINTNVVDALYSGTYDRMIDATILSTPLPILYRTQIVYGAKPELIWQGLFSVPYFDYPKSQYSIGSQLSMGNVSTQEDVQVFSHEDDNVPVDFDSHFTIELIGNANLTGDYVAAFSGVDDAQHHDYNKVNESAGPSTPIGYYTAKEFVVLILSHQALGTLISIWEWSGLIWVDKTSEWFLSTTDPNTAIWFKDFASGSIPAIQVRNLV